MTTQIFFENQTNTNFNLFDIDGNHYGQIPAGNSNSFTLPFSQTFEKQYKLVATTGSFLLFTININGELSGFNVSSGIANLRISNIKTEHLPIPVTKNVIGNILTIQKLTKNVRVPQNTLLIIFPVGLANPIKNFPKQVVFYNNTLPLF